ncbi:uncharacterized protein DEA37_0010979 [Paragonimus westermani]|uniref:EF-hand domain-containing protein n=1 Tax=Paragonimus westermani TaxID=34504 RepID=A0A5J4NL65_9TREM|nr:uncharacterized protein DEA37_0010979 [Paragonimus westermani]
MVMRATNQSLTEAELNDLMTELDVDLTGTLSFDELCIFVGHRIGGHKLQLVADEFLHTLDQDGEFTNSEITSYIRNSYCRVFTQL